jgi:tyrocidine synthetase-3
MKKMDRNAIEDVMVLTPFQQGILFNYLKDPESNLYSEQLRVSISGIGSRNFRPIEAAEMRDYYPLSSSQKRIYILHNMEENSIAYNMPSAMWVEGPLDIERLERICRHLVQRHESLRTSFINIDGEPFQKIHDHAGFEIQHIDPDVYAGNPGSYDKIIADFIRPFDLDRPPLWRVGLLKVAEEKYLLLDDLHHIISDDISIGILITELSELYDGRTRDHLSVQYKDYALWEIQRQKDDSMRDTQEQFWLDRFAGEIPVLDLPADYPRPPRLSFRGANLEFKMDATLTDRLRELAKQRRTTLFVLLFSIYNTLLYKYSGQEDIIVGTPITERTHQDVHAVVGMFVNTLSLRTHPAGNLAFSTFLQQVKEDTVTAFSHRFYPFELLLEQLDLRRDISRNPLFDTMFALHTVDLERIRIPGLNVYPYQFQNPISRLDLTFSVFEARQGLHLLLEYSTALFKKETMERFRNHFINTCRAVLEDPERKLKDIDILSGEEKNRLLVTFNDASAEIPETKPLHRLFEEQAQRTPENVALTGIGHRVAGARHTAPADTSVTYRELNEKAARLAAKLINKGVRQKDRQKDIVAIKTKKSLDMIIGILGILKAGAAYLPIDPQYPKERIDYMLKDSSARALVSWFDGFMVRWLDGSSVPTYQPTNQLTSKPNNLAYVIYTSGSTGKPKAVAVEHGAVVNMLLWRKKEYAISNRHSVLQLASFSFDSSVEEIFTPLISGARILLVPSAYRFDLAYLEEVFNNHHITHLSTVPGFYRSLLDSIPDALTGLEAVTVGGESFGPELVKKHFELLANTALYNEYGPTENSVCTTAFRFNPARDENPPIISIGRPITNVNCFILDRHNHPVPVGVPGDLYISGAGLARGYLNRPELTAERFVISQRLLVNGESSPDDQCPMTNDILYRTGDRACWIPDGNIRFLGRSDSQVKVRGFRIETGEIQSRLAGHKQVKEAAVIARTSEGGDTYLCAYIIPFPGADYAKLPPGLPSPAITETINAYLGRFLPDYMLPSFIVPVKEIPLTANGKIDRNALPEPACAGKKTYTAPRDNIEETLARLWLEALNGNRQSPLMIGIDDNFFLSGGHSLKAAMVVSRFNKQFNTSVSLSRLFEFPTIRTFARFIKESGRQEINREIRPIETGEYYPQSSAQKRLYFLAQMETNQTCYNMPWLVRVTGKLDVYRFRAACRKVILRHETLRTSFHTINGEPVQRVHGQVEFEIRHFKEAASFVRPFDLSQAPLLRLGLKETGPDEHLLILDMHHIIGDGTSMEILVDDFFRFYKGETLPPLKIQYKDFTLWQNRLRTAENNTLRQQEEYWLNLYSHGSSIPRLNLPCDFPRPTIFSFKGATHSFKPDKQDTERLKLLTREHNATLFTVLMTALNILLYKYSGQEDIIVGTSTAGRSHSDLERLIGMFVNELALRNRPTGSKTFLQLLGEVKQATIDAFDNQDIQFEELVDRLNPERDPSRNTLFDVCLSVANFKRPETVLEDIALTPLPMETGTSKFDLTLFAFEDERDGTISFNLEYCTSLFAPDTIRRMAVHFLNILRTVTAAPDIRIEEINIYYPGCSNRHRSLPKTHNPPSESFTLGL